MTKIAVVLFVAVCLSLHVSLSLCAKEPSPHQRRFLEEEYQERFIEWIQKFSKAYSAFEFGPRFNIFKDNWDWIAEFNSRTDRTFEVGDTEFSDITNAEFRNLILMKNYQAAPRSVHEEEYTGEGERVTRANTVDWRTSGAVTPIKNQGQCGSCWTYGSAGAIESIYKISTGNLVQLSEQNLLDCETKSSGCNGGVPVYAMQYVVTNGGIATMASYPYEGKQGTCRYTSAVKGADITGVTRVAKTEAALEAAVNNQPVVVAIDAGQQGFQLYKSGIYNDAACTTTLNHAVIAVGYGTDDATGAAYWIIKNSWGTNWGNAGYIHLAKGSNKCGVANDASFPTRTGGTTPAPTNAPTKAPTGGATTAPTKAPTGGATVAPTKAPTGGATAAPTTPSTVSPVVYQDALGAGWVLTSTGTVSGLTLQGAAQSGTYGVSATVGTNGKLTFSRSTALSTAGYTKLNFAVKASATGNVILSLTSTAKATVPVSSTWKLYSITLASAGISGSLSTVNFQNTGSSYVLGIDNVYLS